MQKLGQLLQRIGQGLMILGGGSLAVIFLIVIVAGSWPDFLHPVQSRFQLISQFLGEFAFIAELALFVGPGAIVWWTGEKIAKRRPN